MFHFLTQARGTALPVACALTRILYGKRNAPVRFHTALKIFLDTDFMAFFSNFYRVPIKPILCCKRASFAMQNGLNCKVIWAILQCAVNQVVI